MTPSIFRFESHQLRTQADQHDAIWFNANDVCTVLEYTNPRDALSKHVDEEDVAKRDTLTAGGVQSLNYVNESGLYSLIMGSRQPQSKRFKRWVTSEVLPSIRKTGAYSAPGAAQTATLPPITLHLRHPSGIQLDISAPGLTLRQVLDDAGWNSPAPIAATVRSARPDEGRTRSTRNYADLFGVTTRQLHMRLERLGLLHRVGNRWVPTDAGMSHVYSKPGSNRPYGGNIRWRQSLYTTLLKNLHPEKVGRPALTAH